MNPWKGLHKLPREVWVITITTFINRAGTMVFPFLIFYLPQIGFSINQSGFIFSLFGIGSFLTAPMAGRLSDKVGALQVMRFSLVLSGAILLVYHLTSNFYLIALLTLAWAVVSESFRPASYAILTTVIDEKDDQKARIQSKQAQALSRLAINLGMAIGPMAASFLAKHHLWKWLFIIDGFTSIAAYLYLSVALGPRRFRVPLALTPTLGARAIKDKRFMFFLLAIIPVLLVFFQEYTSLPEFLKTDLKFDESAYGLLVTLNAVLVIICEVPLNTLTGKWSYARALVWGSLLCGVGYGALTFAGGLWFVGLTVAMWTFGEMLLLPNMVGYVGSVAPRSREGEYMGLYSMVFSLSMTIGPWLGLIALQNLGGMFLWTSTLLMAGMTAVMASRLFGGPVTEISGRDNSALELQVDQS
jgi:MFS family permease